MNATTSTNTSASKKTKPKKTKGPIKPGSARAHEAISYAVRMGFAFLNAEEHQLIKRLRFTTYAGRAIVNDMVCTIQKHHPWIDGDEKHNTQRSQKPSAFFIGA